jgi:hypothetical protein
MLYGKARKSEQRREALLAKINVDAELLLGKIQLSGLRVLKYRFKCSNCPKSHHAVTFSCNIL